MMRRLASEQLSPIESNEMLYLDTARQRGSVPAQYKKFKGTE